MDEPEYASLAEAPAAEPAPRGQRRRGRATASRGAGRVRADRQLQVAVGHVLVADDRVAAAGARQRGLDADGGVEVIDIGQLESKDGTRVRVRWCLGKAVLRDSAVFRINGLNAA
jgi:hypothetical protein